MFTHYKGFLLGAALTLHASTGQGALIERLGGDVYYDDILNVSWLANPGLAASQDYGIAGISAGLMNWNTAQDWLAALNADGGSGYLGFNDWRLPDADVNGDTTVVNCSSGVICLDNELGHMYHFNGVSDSAPGVFTSLYFSYWTGTETANPDFAYRHYMDLGNTVFEDKLVSMGAWAVRSGDVMVVPLPAAFGLFVSGMLLLSATARRVAGCAGSISG